MSGKTRGVALINALIVVAVISVVSVALLRQAEHGRQRSDWLNGTDRVALFLDAGVEEARNILAALPTEGPVYSGQAWATPFAGPGFGHSTQTRRISDLQGRFNVNALASPGASVMAEVFIRMAIAARMAPSAAKRFVEHMTPGTDAASGGQLMTFVHADQLRGFFPGNKAAFERLLPLLAALPPEAKLNANTIAPPLWDALLPGLDRMERSKIAQRLRSQPIAKAADLVEWAEVTLGEAEALAIAALELGGGSEWFQIDLETRLDKITVGRSVVVFLDGTQQRGSVIMSLPRPD